MGRKYSGLALIPHTVLPAFLGFALLSGCGRDDGSPKPMVLSDENKANIEAERAADEQARGKKSNRGQP